MLRIVIGLLFAFHGLQKTFGILSQFQPPLASQVGIGGVIELITGLLIAVGLFTRESAFLASGTMLVAYAQFHWKFAMGSAFLPAINKGEPALLFCLIFLYMACRGAGPLSADALRSRPK
jgi:putative oxidoreductase